MAFPTVISTTTGRTTNTNTTSHPITLPSGLLAGDLLLVFFSIDGSPNLSYTSGWFPIEQETYGSFATGVLFYKYATSSSDTLTITSSPSEASTHIVYQVRNSAPPMALSGRANAGQREPTSLDTGMERDYLAIASTTLDTTSVATAAPSGFSNLVTRSAAGSNGVSVSTAQTNLAASVISPGPFTKPTAALLSFTVALGYVGTYDLQIGLNPTVVNDDSVGTGDPWANPGNASARDGTFATMSVSGTTIRNYLRAHNYGFSISADQEILGVVAKIRKLKSDSNSGSIADREVKLVKGGVVSSSSRHISGVWPTAVSTLTHGGASDLWGDSLGPSDINDPNFGLVMNARTSSSSSTNIANVDSIQLIVYYTKATGTKKVYSDGAWSNKPVKVYIDNGWVIKKQKKWNGSTWVDTSS